MPADRDRPIVACALEAAEHEERLAWIKELNAAALSGYHRDGDRIQLKYRPTAAAKAREFVRRERECCPFLHFTTLEGKDAFVVIIDAPAELGTAADALFASYTTKG